MKRMLLVTLLGIVGVSLYAENYVKLYIKESDKGYTVIFVDSTGKIVKKEEAYPWQDSIMDTSFVDKNREKSSESSTESSTFSFDFSFNGLDLPPHWKIALSGAMAGSYYAAVLPMCILPDSSPVQLSIISSILVWIGMTVPPIFLLDDVGLDKSAGAVSSYNYLFGPVDGFLLNLIYDDSLTNDKVVFGTGIGLGYLYNGVSIYFMRNRGWEHRYGDMYGVNGVIGYAWGALLGSTIGVDMETPTFITSALMRGFGFYMADRWGYESGDAQIFILNSLIGGGLGGELIGIYMSYVDSTLDNEVITGALLAGSVSGYLATAYLLEGGLFGEISATLLWTGAMVGSSVGGSLSALYAATFDNYPPFPVITGTTIGAEYLVYKLIKSKMPSLLKKRSDISFYPIKNGIGFTYSF